MCGPGGSDMSGQVGLDAEGRPARICTEGPNFPAAIADAGGPSGAGKLTTGRHLGDRCLPLTGRRIGHRVAMASSGQTTTTHEGTAVTWNAS
jgi:hypothetical protein